MTLQDLLAKLKKPKRSGSGWKALCPAHDDKTPSLGIWEMNGWLNVKCHAGCDEAAVLEALGIQKHELGPERPESEWKTGDSGKKHISDIYDYVDLDGLLKYQTVKYDLPIKDFRQRRPDPSGEPGEYIWNMEGVKRILYRLPELVKAVEDGVSIFVAEGEKDVDNLIDLGLRATSSVGGAEKWRLTDTSILHNSKVFVIPDKDPIKRGKQAGYAHAKMILDELPNAILLILPSPPEYGDVSDWIEAGGTREQLIDLAKEARRNPVKLPRPTPPEDKSSSKKKRMKKEVVQSPIGTVDKVKSTRLSEHAAARRLLKLHGEDMRHAAGLGWLVWDGYRWARREKAAWRRVQDLSSVVRAELADLGMVPEDIAKAYYAHAKRIESAAGKKAILEEAEAVEGIDGDSIEWDAQPWMLNCPNGILDLRTGRLGQHVREHHITKLCAVEYDPAAVSPAWIKFLEEVFGWNYDVINYLQWALGYALTGRTDHDVFYVLHGEGSNGKTTLLDVVQSVLGEDYSQQISPEELMAQTFARHTTELAQLRGARLVVATETSEGRRLNEPLIKALTGGDKMRARFMREDSFEFMPELKLFIGTNHRPVIRDGSVGMWRRVRLIPFEVQFLAEQRDPYMKEKLLEEREGILAWLVAGAMQVEDGEPNLPDVVSAATQEYQTDSDVLGKFLEEECDLLEHFTVSKSVLYRAFHAWTNGRCESKKAFGTKIASRGFEESSRHGAQRAWKGIGLLSQMLQE